MTHHQTVPLSVELRGNYHEGNFGDDALLLACIFLLRDQTRRIQLERKAAYQDNRLKNIVVPGKGKTPPNLVVFGGGTQFFSFSMSSKDVQYSRISRFTKKILSPTSLLASFRARIAAAQYRQLPKIALGIGVGPFELPLAGEQTVELLRQMELVWVRDPTSEKFCRNHNIPNLVNASDLCFTPAFSQIAQPLGHRATPHDRPRRIGIVLRDWPSLDAHFFQRQVALARKLRACGHQVRFLSLSMQDNRYMTKMRELRERVIVWDATSGTLEEFWHTIAEQDLVLTSRFHGAIFALLSRTPFISIEIEPKLKNLRFMVPELGAYAITPSTNVDNMYLKVDELLAKKQSLLPALDKAVSKQRSLARTGEEALKTYFAAKKLR